MINDATFGVTCSGEDAGSVTVRKSGLVTVFEYTCPRTLELSRLVLLTPSGAVSVGIPAPRDDGMYLLRALSRAALGGVELDGELRFILTDIDADLSALSSPPEPAAADEEAPASSSEDSGEPEAEDFAEPEAEDFAEQEAEPASPELPASEPRANGTPPSIAAAAPPPPEPAVDGWYIEPEPQRLFADETLRSAASGVEGVLSRSEGGDTLLAFPFSPSEPFPLIPAFRLGSAETIGGRSYMVFRVRDGQPL